MCAQPDVHSKCSRAAVVCSGVCLCKASLPLVKAPAKEQHLLLIPSLFIQELRLHLLSCWGHWE